MEVDLLKLTWRKFEDLIHDLLEAEGFKVIYHAGKGQDKGRDLQASINLKNDLEVIRKSYLVQCKRYKKTVYEKDVPDIYDKIRQFGVNGYLLAVTSDVSSGLNDKINDININNKEFCGIWRPRDIIGKLLKNESVLMTYFSEIYNYYFGKVTFIPTIELIRAYESRFKHQPTEDTIRKYRDLVDQLKIADIQIVEDILKDPSVEEELNKIYRDLLKRDVDDVGLLSWGYWWKYLPEGRNKLFIKNSISQSDEFKSINRFIYDPTYLNMPICKIIFDSVNQSFYNWKTYHSDVSKGRLEVKIIKDPSIGPTNTYFVEISSPNKNTEFRMLFFENINLPNKNTVTLNISEFTYFQLYLLVIADDKKPYFIEYIYEEGGCTTEINPKDKIEYIQIRTTDLRDNVNWKMLNRDFNKDFMRIKNLNVLKVINVYLGVKGKIRIHNMIIA